MTRILLVDDAELMLGIERTFLKRTGSELLTAQSGEDALLKVRRHRPDLVLLDANMHGMSGLTCCRELKADPALRGSPSSSSAPRSITTAASRPCGASSPSPRGARIASRWP